MDYSSPTSKAVCVTGATGFIGSWLVMRLLQRGYAVRASVRDLGNMRKVKHLLELPNADTHLTLWKADLGHEGSFDGAVDGCIGVFHVATPLDFESEDPENDMIKPTVNGLLDIMKACVKAKTVRRLIFTSSAATLSATEHQKAVIDETCWSDVEFCRKAKMTGWAYFVSKTLAEQEAWKFAKEHNMDFISVIPPHVVGPFLMNSMPSSFIWSLALITGNEGSYSLLKTGHFVHVDDLCMCHIFLFEHPKAEGRYICSSDKATIHEIAKLLDQNYPEYNVPTKFRNIPEDLEIALFSTKKITKLGFQFKHNLEDMYTAAIDACREKGLLPKYAKALAHGTAN